MQASVPSPPFAGPWAPSFRDRTCPQGILDLRSQLVDPVTGPIRSLERFQCGPGDPRVHHWIASLADPGWAESGFSPLYCGGNDLDDQSAQAAALGEALERMSSCPPASTDPLLAPYRDLGADAVDPRGWDLFHPATRALPGFPYAPVSPEDPLTWVWGWSRDRRCDPPEFCESPTRAGK